MNQFFSKKKHFAKKFQGKDVNITIYKYNKGVLKHTQKAHLHVYMLLLLRASDAW